MASPAPALARCKTLYDSLEELALIHAAQQGDESAFTELYYQNHARIKMVIHRIVKDDDIAEWHTNIALTRVWENLGRFDEKSKFSTWVTRIAINEGLMHLRKQKNNHVESLDDLELERDGCFPHHQHWLASRDLELEGIADRQVLTKAIRRVPVRYRIVLRLRFWDGYSVEEIRQILQAKRKNEITIPYIKTLLFRGKARMKENIQTLSTPKVTGF